MTLQKLKNHLKKVKPKFLAQDSHKYKRIKNRWRKARGSDSKIGHKINGRRARVECGYGTPKSLRGTTQLGLKKVYISNLNELNNSNLENSCIVLNAGIGKKNKIKILELAKEKNVKVLGYKKLDEKISQIKTEIKERQNKKKNKVEEKKTTEKNAETKETDKKEVKQVETKKENKETESKENKIETENKKEEQKPETKTTEDKQ